MFVNSWFSFFVSQAPEPLPLEEILEPFPPTRTTSFTIRTAQGYDLLNLAEILADSFHDRAGFTGLIFPLLRLGIYEDLRNRLRSSPPHYACLVAVAEQPVEQPEELIGTIELALRLPPPWQFRPPHYPYISNLAVKKIYRRQGTAMQLLAACERLVMVWGFEDLYLHVLENNYEARRLYLKAGYQLQGVEHSWWSWLLGQPKRLFLHKHLQPSS